MIRIYTHNGFHDLPDTLMSVLGKIVAQSIAADADVNPTEATPVLTDEPEDPEVTIETLQARILHLEAELEEHRRAVDSVIEALRGLGSISELPVKSETTGNATEPVGGLGGYQTGQNVNTLDGRQYNPDYAKAQAGARSFLGGIEPIPGSSWVHTPNGWVRKIG